MYCFTVNQITATSTAVSHMLLLSLVTPLWKLFLGPILCLKGCRNDASVHVRLKMVRGGEGEGGVFTFEYFLALCGMTVFFPPSLL